MEIITTITQQYMNTFRGYTQSFLHWGQWLFFGLLTINLVWLCLWQAFDRPSLAESMPRFIQRFFIITLFYTLMLHPAWLMDVLKTMQFMGTRLNHAAIDPSALIWQGITLGNKVILPIEKSSLITALFGVMIIAIVYVIILFVFISVALDLAVTLIMVTALISIASFFLGFAALGATTPIARQTLDIILGLCVKLLGLYLVIAAGSQTLVTVIGQVPTRLVAFDPYAWIVAVVLLFWLLAKHLPQQLVRIVSGAVHDSPSTGGAALALSTARYAAGATPLVSTLASATVGVGRLAGSSVYNAAAHVRQGVASSPSVPMGLSAAALGTMGDLGKAVIGNVSDHFRQVASTLAGGPRFPSRVASVPERLYVAAQDLAVSSSAAPDNVSPS